MVAREQLRVAQVHTKIALENTMSALAADILMGADIETLSRRDTKIAQAMKLISIYKDISLLMSLDKLPEEETGEGTPGKMPFVKRPNEARRFG